MLDYAAFPQQRQALICQILQENGRVVCAELAARLQVSEHTIRRDLHDNQSRADDHACYCSFLII
ncbi:hypothetical protein A7K92_26760 [Klebsiella pneumoniae]|nr:hypothetical protein A7K92_26760 [Klebsiella pneumoniae]